MVLAAFLAGYNYVGDVVANKTWHQYLHIAMFEEIIPALKVRFAFAEGELESFANAVFDRFANPYIHHELLAIAYNSTSKVRERVLPSIVDYVALKQSLPPILTFSFAAFIAFYKAVDKDEDGYYAYRNGEKYYIKDEPQNVEHFYNLWQSGQALKEIVYDICANTRLWKTDLSEINGFVDMVAQHLLQIDTNGMTKTIEMLVA